MNIKEIRFAVLTIHKILYLIATEFNVLDLLDGRSELVKAIS